MLRDFFIVEENDKCMGRFRSIVYGHVYYLYYAYVHYEQ